MCFLNQHFQQQFFGSTVKCVAYFYYSNLPNLHLGTCKADQSSLSTPTISSSNTIQFLISFVVCANGIRLKTRNEEKESGNKCGQIGRFLKILDYNFSYKSSPQKWGTLGLIKTSLLKKTAVVTFWSTFETIWATFYYFIWSHCCQRTIKTRSSVGRYSSMGQGK